MAAPTEADFHSTMWFEIPDDTPKASTRCAVSFLRLPLPGRLVCVAVANLVVESLLLAVERLEISWRKNRFALVRLMPNCVELILFGRSRGKESFPGQDAVTPSGRVRCPDVTPGAGRNHVLAVGQRLIQGQ